MKQSPLRLSQCRVNFKYSSSPTRQAVPQAPVLPAARPHEFSSSKTSQSAIHTDQTLKKEGHSLEAVTMRKELRKAQGDPADETDLTADADHPLGETAILRDEIRYMRSKLIEAQNAEKELRLEFELYKAGVEQHQARPEGDSHQQRALSAEIQSLRGELRAREEIIHSQQAEKGSMCVLLGEQTKRAASLQRSLKQKQEENKQLTFQTREMYNQIQMRCADLNAISQDLLTLSHNNQLFYNQNNFLKEVITQKDATVLHLQGEADLHRQKCIALQEKVDEQEREISLLQLRMAETEKERQEMIAKYEADVTSSRETHEREMKSCKRLYEEQYCRKLKQAQTGLVFPPIEAHPLSTAELQQHLSLLKNQPDQPSAQQCFQARQESEALREQIQLMRITHEQQLQQLRQQYESQMGASNEEYTQQLMIYMKEVDVLMEEMAKLKQKRQICQEVIEEEPEEENENEYDEDRVRNDLRLYGDDTSDVYMSPPSTVKKPSEEDTHQFMLNEIIDLDSKINNYIANFNKRRQEEEGQGQGESANDQ